ncbi:hypothetical protein PSH58_18135 [Pseudomonas hefeiensis]|uniref:DUF4760 domain-containing protein n=1 Tax=Pseudomonas hefeiensis TaxID=2738125 RepID=A0ABY9G5C5_9PSED|nr:MULTISPECIES: hypothetical protein [unclassified Pseudomonas]WLH10796.1 hypothetical protein PSH57_18105 [Pseudomonas sp. FP205]WLH93877.1 hypothetical protein PSH58_18135 [Pseudomonas sp. FP53]WLI38152.1 hypothetical protein PSH74_18065 [Pseudomonas sp. FP821]
MKLDSATWANVIAGSAFFVSIVAAFFSWRSVSQAKRANNISIHQYQKELHRAFFEVRRLLSGRGLLLKQQDLAPYGMIFRSSAIYVSDALSKQLLEFFHGCFEVENLHTSLDMNRDYVRLFSNEETGLGGIDLKAHQANAEEGVKKARSELMERLKLMTELGAIIEAKFVQEIKLSS